MTYSYFPGCTLKNKAKDLEAYGLEAAKCLGADLEEIPEWQCCGGVYPLSADEIAIKLSSVRALACASASGNPLVTMCSACHHVIKRVNHDMAENEYVSTRANNYLKADGIEYHGETRVIHYLEMLRDDIGFDKIKEAVKAPLTDKKIGAYYGCLLLRPSNIMAMDNAENPSIIEDLLAALGAKPVVYAMRNECCGGYRVMNDPKVPEKRAKAIIEDAKANGAEMIVTACPLCYYNLKNYADESGIEVKYFTEVLAQALGCADTETAQASTNTAAQATENTAAQAANTITIKEAE